MDKIFITIFTGSHGSGGLDETATPIVAWGAGISRTKSPSSGTQVASLKIEQADIAPLMSALLGIPIPVHSVVRSHKSSDVLVNTSSSFLLTPPGAHGGLPHPQNLKVAEFSTCISSFGITYKVVVLHVDLLKEVVDVSYFFLHMYGNIFSLDSVRLPPSLRISR